ncbi:MAG: hypothetical protein ACK50P_15090 [Planctomycetaceae bacterium]|jgi:hypothetical protein
MLISFVSPVQGGFLVRQLGALTVGPVKGELNFNDFAPDPIEKSVDPGPLREMRHHDFLAVEGIGVCGQLYGKNDRFEPNMPMPNVSAYLATGIVTGNQSPYTFELKTLTIPDSLLTELPVDCQVIVWVKWKSGTTFTTRAATLTIQIRKP